MYSAWSGCHAAARLERHAHGAAKRLHIHLRSHKQILHVHVGLGDQAHAAEDAEEAEKVLILQICRAAALVHLHGQHVARWADMVREVEFRHGEAVLRIAQEMPVQPDEHRLFHSPQSARPRACRAALRLNRTCARTSPPGCTKPR